MGWVVVLLTATTQPPSRGIFHFLGRADIAIRPDVPPRQHSEMTRTIRLVIYVFRPYVYVYRPGAVGHCEGLTRRILFPSVIRMAGEYSNPLRMDAPGMHSMLNRVAVFGGMGQGTGLCVGYC